MRTLTMLLLLVLFCIAEYNALEEKTAEAVALRAVRGLDARLPCGQGKVFLDGPEAYVVWKRHDGRTLYRYPSENSEKRATRDFMYGTLCESKFCPDNTSLLIKKASNRDEGLYICKVHYQASPVVDYVINVKLVESTGVPKLFDGSGERLNLGFVGPLTLGSDLNLICEVMDNDLETDVYWRRNGVIVDPLYTSRPGKLRTDVHLRNISRDELNAHYECLAENSDVSEALSASVTVKMVLPPLSVEIRMNDSYDFEAGQPRVADCVVVGCMPPPAVTWTLGGKMIRPTVHKELHDGNFTISSLMLAPSLRDHHSELVCSAHNLYMPNVLFQDKVTLNVGFRPTCQVGREEKIGAVIGEAQSVRCVVDAYPEPLQFSWTFPDSNTLFSDFTKLSGYRNRYTSNLTWLTRSDDFGILTCRAINIFGEQKVPCTYKITAGGPPELPECNLQRIYPNSLRVQCVKGWDGGRPQTIHLDIVDENGCRVKNITDKSGHFFVPNIEDKRNMTAVLYASNSRGKSDKLNIYLQTLTLVFEAENNIESAWMQYIEGLACAVALGFAAFTITLIYKILKTRRERLNNINLDIVPCSTGVFHREPDVVRLNQLPACPNQYSPSPLPACRVLVGHGSLSPNDACSSSQHCYYV